MNQHLDPATILQQGFAAVAPARSDDRVVDWALDCLRPEAAKSLCRSSRLALVLRRRCERSGDRLVSAGQLRAARTNKKLGRDVADSESATFAQELAARTGMNPRRARRLVSFGALGATALRRLEHTPGDTQRNLGRLLGLDEAYRNGTPSTAEDVEVDWWTAVPGFRKTETLFLLPRVTTLLCGDSRDVLAAFPSESFDGVVSDQPYEIDYRSGVVAGDQVGETTPWLIPEVRRLLKNDRFAVLHGVDRNKRRWQELLATGRVPLERTIIWDTVHPSVRGKMVRNAHEEVWVCTKGNPTPFAWTDRWDLTGAGVGKRVKKDVSLWRHAKPVGNAKRHDTSKPPELHQRELCNFVAAGGRVLDPCMGSGPVATAALRTGHRFVGVEKMARHYRSAVERVEAELRRPEAASHWKAVLDL